MIIIRFHGFNSCTEDAIVQELRELIPAAGLTDKVLTQRTSVAVVNRIWNMKGEACQYLEILVPGRRSNQFGIILDLLKKVRVLRNDLRTTTVIPIFTSGTFSI